MPPNRLQRSLRATFLGLAVNVALVVAKFLAGILGHSQALIADAVESLADIFSSIIVWRALVVAETPPDEDHPYGHGKAEPLAAATVSVMMLLAAGMIAYHSLSGIEEPRLAPSAWTLILLVAVIAVKEVLFRFVLHEAGHAESSAVATDAWHHRSDALTSIAAFIGISVALIGGPRWQSADDWAAIFACVVIAANGIRLLRPAFYEIMDTAPRKIVKSICSVASSVPGVIEVEKCRARKMGLDFYVDLHVGVDGKISVHDGHEIAHRVKAAIQQSDSRIADVLVHIEPAGNL